MTKTVNIYDAKTHLSRLVDQAAAGEDIVIARAGKPMVRLVPVERKAHLNIDLPDEFFFDPLPEDELKLWE